MEDINWLQIIIGLISGGAFGAIIKIIVDNRKNRTQPIARTIDCTRIFDSRESPLDSRIELKEGNSSYTFATLYSCKIRIYNVGQKDYSEFKFGITTKRDTKIIRFEAEAKDRHHNALTEKQIPSLQYQLSEIDIVLMPLNRRDYYTIDLLLTNDLNSISSTDIELSTSEPIKWVGSDSTGKILSDIAKTTIVALGPSIEFRMK